MIEKRATLATFAATVLLTLSSLPVAGATPIWPGQAIDPSGVRTWITVSPDGVDHVVASSLDDGYTSSYAVDRGNQWAVTSILGRPLDVAADAAGTVYMLVATAPDDPNGPLLHVIEDAGAGLVDHQIPSAFHAKIGTIAIDGAGGVHVAWGDTYADVSYSERVGGVWSAPVSSAPGVSRVDAISIAVDGADHPHVLASGTFDVAALRPSGCANLANTTCLIDMAFVNPVVLTTIAALDPHTLDAITGPGGAIDAVGADNTTLRHFSNSGGGWTTETVASGTITTGSLVLGPSGLVAFYDLQDTVGVRRADLVTGTWHGSLLGTGAAQDSVGTVDAAGDAHVVFIRNVFKDPKKVPPPNGNVPVAFVAAPDRAGPLATPPLTKPTAGKAIGSTIPVSVSWTAGDALSGVARYQVQQSTGGGTYATVSSTLTTKYVARSLKSGGSYAFRVRGIDRAGNVGSFATGPTIKATLYQQTSTALHWAGSWHTTSGTGYSGSSARYATSSTASVSITTSARGFGWISTYASNRGSVKVYVDGVWITTISLKKASTTYRVVAWSIAWPSTGTHTLMLRSAGTARVDVDGLVIVR